MRTTLRALLAAAAALAAFAALSLAAVLLWPAKVLPFAAEAAAGVAGVPLSIGGASGGFLDGFVLRDVSMGLPAAQVSAESLVLRARWRLLADARLSIERLEARGLVVRLREPPDETGEEEEESAGGPPPLRVSADRLLLRDGLVQLRDGRVLRDVDLRGAYAGGRLIVTEAGFEWERSRIEAAGAFAPEPLRGWADVRARGPLELDLAVRGATDRWTVEGGARYRGASAAVRGRLAGEDWTARASFRNVEPAWVGAGFLEGKLSGELTASGRGKTWPFESAEAGFDLRSARGSAAGSARLRGGEIVWGLRLKGEVAGSAEGTWRADGRAGAAEWTLTAERPELERWTGASSATFRGRAEARRLPDGWTVFGRGLELNAGPYVDLKGRFALSGRNLAVPELVWRTPGGDLTARGDVTFTGQGPPDFDLRLRGEEVSLGFLAGWAPGTEIEGSRLGADVSLVRKDGVFAPGGTLRLGASRLKGTPARLDLRDISLLFEAGRDRLEIVEGAAKTQKGRVTFSGHVGVDGPDVTVHAEGLAFRAPGEVEGAVSGTLTLEGAWPAPKATGDLRVDRADYRPAKKEKKEKEEKGAEGASAADEAPSPPGPLAADVRVRFDRDVWYKDGSNYVELKGDLRLRKERWEPLRLIGKIETLRGRYSLYGRTFDVQKGRATFHGELPVDPALDVRAMYLEENSGTKVFIDVGGTAKEPKIELSSLPPMEEQDILAVLAFGRPLDGAEGPGGSAAAQSLVANYLLQKTRDIPLVRQLDLDILQVERSPAGDTSLTVGRYVSPDLFVSYDQTVGDDGQRRLNAEYTLTDHWSLFGRRSKGNHYVIDLLFKFGVR